MNQAKKASAPIFLIASALVLMGCGGSSEPSSSETTVQESPTAMESPAPSTETSDGSAEETSGDVEVDEGLFSTEVKIPLDLFTMGSDNPDDVPTQEEIQASLDEEGRNIEATLNDDGTVTYRMSRGEYDRFKSDLKASADESIQQSINEESDIYKSVTYSDDLREFSVTVNREAYENGFSFLGFSLLFTGLFYQAFTGVPDEDRFVQINLIDESTGEVFQTDDSTSLQEGE